MKLNYLLWALLGIISFNTAFGRQSFQPTIRFFESYTFFNEDTKLLSGKVTTEQRKMNFGFELTQKIFLPNGFFLNLGLRYQNFKKNIAGVNQIEELYDYPAPFYGEYRYAAYSIPVQLGRFIYIANQKRGYYYLGGSIGVISNSYIKNGINSVQPKSNSFTANVITDISFEKDPSNHFFPNAELGLVFSPFSNFVKLSFGVHLSAQLNKGINSELSGSVTVPSLNYEYLYQYKSSSSVVGIGLSVGYTF